MRNVISDMKPVIRQLIVIAVGVFLFYGSAIEAQDTTLDLTLIAEHDIGWHCPLATAVQPETQILWVLQDDCFGSPFSLHRFDVNTGEALDEPLVLEALDRSLYEVYGFNKPMGFTSAGNLQFFVSNSEDYTLTRFEVNLESGDVSTDANGDERLDALFRKYTQYPSFVVVFSSDQHYAAVSDDEGLTLYVLDLVTEELLFQLEVSGAIAAFSPETQRLYVTAPVEPDNFENTSGTLFIYNLTDGALLQSLPLPVISIVYPSRDGLYVAIETAPGEVGTEELGIIELASGAASPLLRIGTDPLPVLKCVNDGTDLSDYDYRTSGYLPLVDLHWLADQSGFVTVNSQDGTATNTGCVFDYSRLRQYQVVNNEPNS